MHIRLHKNCSKHFRFLTESHLSHTRYFLLDNCCVNSLVENLKSHFIHTWGFIKTFHRSFQTPMTAIWEMGLDSSLIDLLKESRSLKRVLNTYLPSITVVLNVKPVHIFTACVVYNLIVCTYNTYTCTCVTYRLRWSSVINREIIFP